MPSTDQSFKIFPRHNTVATESFALNLIISVPLTNKCLLHYNASLNNFVSPLLKLIESIFSAVNVHSNPFVVPLPRIKISFFLLSIFVDELISTPTIITF